jgi:hypothetical protein
MERHGIHYQTLPSSLTKPVLAQHLATYSPQDGDEKERRLWDIAVVSERHIALPVHPGDLWIDLAQPLGRLAVLLLEPRSSSSLFRTPYFAEMLKVEEAFFVYRVDGE